MTTEPEILATIAALLARLGGRDHLDPIGRDTLFFADLGLASIDAVVLGEELQVHYGRPIPFDLMMAELGTRADRDLQIGELADFLARHLNP